ncbi:MAG: SnoaL-like domain protein [Marmoricola sp.]|nr:SnoaL-like domain protein [Marmoricola sp.]
MSTPSDVGLQRWHAAVGARDAGMLPAMIAEDAVFRSPAVHTPQEGRDLVVSYLSAAFVVLGPELSYLDTWQREHDAVLRFTTVIDGLQIEGIDMITWDENGLITEFTVMARPFKGLQALIGAMAKQLFG